MAELGLGADGRDVAEGGGSGGVTETVAGELVELGKKLWSVGKQRRIWAPTAFVFLWQATPNPGTAMFYFTTNQLGFTSEFLGRVALARAVASLVGVVGTGVKGKGGGGAERRLVVLSV